MRLIRTQLIITPESKTRSFKNFFFKIGRLETWLIVNYLNILILVFFLQQKLNLKRFQEHGYVSVFILRGLCEFFVI